METLKAIQKFVLFFLLMILVSDIGGAFYTKVYYQGGMDFAVKAASMEIVRDDDYANGIIKIDEDRSKEEFTYVMQRQFSLSEDTVQQNTIYASPVNTAPYNFIHPVTGRSYIIHEPMFIAVYRVRRRGVFIRNDILVDNLSGSRVTMRPK